MENPLLQSSKIILDAFTDIVTQDQKSTDVEPHAAAHTTKRLPVLIIPRVASVKEKSPTKSYKRHSAKGESNAKLIDERKSQLVAR